MREPAELLVITPTLGRSPWLADVVSDVAVLASTARVTHVLVAPAGVAVELHARFPGLQVVEEPARGGMYAAINAGVAAAGDWRWLTYLNDDDRLLGASAEALPGASGFDVVYGQVDYIDAKGKTIAPMPVCRRPADVLPLLARGVAAFTQQGTFVGRALWDRLGGFDASLKLAGDHDFWLRAALDGAAFHFNPARVASFRIRAGQLSGDVGAAEAELRAISARAADGIGALRILGALMRFRVSNLGRILKRVSTTGRLRSRKLYEDGMAS